MICDNCKLIKICKNYDFLKRHKELTISSCEYYICCTNTGAVHIKTSAPVFPFVSTTTESTKKPILTCIKPEKAPTIINCPTCNSETYDYNIQKCNKCGAEICPECTTVDIDTTTGNAINLCPECYGIDLNAEPIYDSNKSIKDIFTINLKKEDDEN